MNWQEYAQGSDPADPAAEEFRGAPPGPVGELALPQQPRTTWFSVLSVVVGAVVVLSLALLLWLRVRAHRRKSRSPDATAEGIA